MSRLRPWYFEFWSPTSVVKKFENGELTKEDKVWYIAVSMFMAGGLTIGFPVAEGDLYWYTDMMILSFISLWAVFYFASRHSSQTSFVEKVIIVFTAATFNVMFFVGIPFFAVSMILYLLIFGGSIPDYTTWFDSLVLAGFYIVMYLYMAKWFPKEAGKELPKPEAS